MQYIFRAVRILSADFNSEKIRTLPCGFTKFYVMGLLSAYFVVDKQIPIKCYFTYYLHETTIYFLLVFLVS